MGERSCSHAPFLRVRDIQRRTASTSSRVRRLARFTDETCLGRFFSFAFFCLEGAAAAVLLTMQPNSDARHPLRDSCAPMRAFALRLRPPESLPVKSPITLVASRSAPIPGFSLSFGFRRYT